MANNKLVTLDNLQTFLEECDERYLKDADYAHITITENSVSDGVNTLSLEAITTMINEINDKLENEVITKSNLNENLPRYNGEII